jgi:hypothetical protein
MSRTTTPIWKKSPATRMGWCPVDDGSPLSLVGGFMDVPFSRKIVSAELYALRKRTNLR